MPASRSLGREPSLPKTRAVAGKREPLKIRKLSPEERAKYFPRPPVEEIRAFKAAVQPGAGEESLDLLAEGRRDLGDDFFPLFWPVSQDADCSWRHAPILRRDWWLED